MSLSVQLAAASYIFLHYLLKKKTRKPRRWWIKTVFANRTIYSGSSLLRDLKFQSVSGQYKNFTRMSPTEFEYLLNLVGKQISKNDTICRKAIPAQERLAITLRFLATGDSYTSLQYLFKVSKQTISEIIPEVCSALVDRLKHYIQIPKTEKDWLFVAKQFDELWNCPHTLGAIDGKHIVIQCPIRSGSEFFSYKETFSIVLFALVDANYNFMFVDVGCQGRISDGGVFANTELYKKLEAKSLCLPEPKPLVNGSTKCIPYFIVGDEAFALTEYLMKVYSGFHPKGSKERIYNYRICRARRIVENVFGIVSSVFRVLRKPMLLEPEKAGLVVMTITCLHNFLRRQPQSQSTYTPFGTFDHEENGQLIEGSWRTAHENETLTSLLPVRRVPRRSSLKAKEIRMELTNYFINEGRIEWQEKYA